MAMAEGTIVKDAKEYALECVLDSISFITSEVAEKCQIKKEESKWQVEEPPHACRLWKLGA